MNSEQMGQAIWTHRVSMTRLASSIVASSQDVEDTVSEAVVKAMQGAEKLRDETKLKSWLLSITAHCCYDLLRAKKREQLTNEAKCFDMPVFDHALDGTLQASIQMLEPKYRQVLILYYYEEFVARDIAGILGISLSTVLMRLKRGREKLKTIYQNMEGGDQQ